MAAPIGNRNSMQHGLRADGRFGLTLGRLPAGSAYIGRLLGEFRRGLERAVVEVKGSISRADAGLISRACHWERHSLLARKWLREQAGKMNPETQLRFSREVAEAADRRESSIGRLGIAGKIGTDPLDD